MTFRATNTRRNMPNPISYAEQICYSTKETLHFTHEVAVKYRLVDGCYVEVGCAAGAQVIAMLHGAPDKTVFAFDSFQGIPLPSNRDDQYPGIRMISSIEQNSLPEPGTQIMESSGATVVPLESFIEHIQKSGVKHENLRVVKGWFELTLPNNEVGPIAILRLDGDLYHSTYIALKYLFPKVVQGGMVIVDDFELPGCRQACIDYFQQVKYFPKYESVSNIKYFYK